MSLFYTIVALLVVMELLGAVGGTSISLEQQAYAKPSEKKNPCTAFKLLAKYVEAVGLQAVATGDEDEMSTLVDDFRHYSKEILQFSPPDKGKC
jgi:hypothetical protein